jgi:hypothetical protein
MKITIGVNPTLQLEALAVIEKDNTTSIYLQYSEQLHSDLKIILNEEKTFYKGKILSTIMSDNKSIVLIF